MNIYPEAQFELLRLTIEQQEGGGTVTRQSIRWARSKEFFVKVHFRKDVSEGIPKSQLPQVIQIFQLGHQSVYTTVYQSTTKLKQLDNTS